MATTADVLANALGNAKKGANNTIKEHMRLTQQTAEEMIRNYQAKKPVNAKKAATTSLDLRGYKMSNLANSLNRYRKGKAQAGPSQAQGPVKLAVSGNSENGRGSRTGTVFFGTASQGKTGNNSGKPKSAPGQAPAPTQTLTVNKNRGPNSEKAANAQKTNNAAKAQIQPVPAPQPATFVPSIAPAPAATTQPVPTINISNAEARKAAALSLISKLRINPLRPNVRNKEAEALINSLIKNGHENVAKNLGNRLRERSRAAAKNGGSNKSYKFFGNTNNNRRIEREIQKLLGSSNGSNKKKYDYISRLLRNTGSRRNDINRMLRSSSYNNYFVNSRGTKNMVAANPFIERRGNGGGIRVRNQMVNNRGNSGNRKNMIVNGNLVTMRNTGNRIVDSGNRVVNSGGNSGNRGGNRGNSGGNSGFTNLFGGRSVELNKGFVKPQIIKAPVTSRARKIGKPPGAPGMGLSVLKKLLKEAPTRVLKKVAQYEAPGKVTEKLIGKSNLVQYIQKEIRPSKRKKV